jgi:hypothetical protein
MGEAQHRAAAEGKRAEENFDIAVTTADTIVTTVAERLRNLTGVSTATIREILTSAEGAFNKIAVVAPNSQQLRWRRAVMLISFTDTYQTIGETGEAFDRAQTARTLMLKLIDENPANTDWLETLSESDERVGEVLVDQGNLAAALGEHRALSMSSAVSKKKTRGTSNGSVTSFSLTKILAWQICARKTFRAL